MTTHEFSAEFDILLNSYSIPSLFGTTYAQGDIVVDEYEKSVFLTTAQEQIILHYKDQVDNSEEFRRQFSSLIKTTVLDTPETDVINVLTPESKIYKLPDDVWFILYEHVIIEDSDNVNGVVHLVVPTSEDLVYKSLENPFKRPNINKVLRVDVLGNCVELIPAENDVITNYKIRYIKKPTPIIVTDLTASGLSINGINTKTECTLGDSLHREILNKAVELAIASKINANQK